MAAALPGGTWRLGVHVLSHGTDGLPQLLFPQEGSQLPVPSQRAGEEETVVDDTTHTGSLCSSPHDQGALLSPPGTQRNME